MAVKSNFIVYLENGVSYKSLARKIYASLLPAACVSNSNRYDEYLTKYKEKYFVTLCVMISAV